MSIRRSAIIISLSVFTLFFRQELSLGQGEVVAPESSSVEVLRSVSGVSVAGNGRISRVSLLTWCDEILENVGTTYGHKAVSLRRWPLRIVLKDESSRAGGRVVKAQNERGTALGQVLFIEAPDVVPQEDILEGMCWLLLNRYVVAKQSLPQRSEKLGTVPDWLAVGLAQEMYAPLRARNNRIVVNAWREGVQLSAAQTLAGANISPEQTLQRAVAAVFYDWISSFANSDELFPAMFSLMASGRDVTPEWLANRIPELSDAADVEQQWDLWVATRQQINFIFEPLRISDVVALELALIVCPTVLSVAAERNIADALTEEQLIAWRHCTTSEWCP